MAIEYYVDLLHKNYYTHHILGQMAIRSNYCESFKCECAIYHFLTRRMRVDKHQEMLASAVLTLLLGFFVSQAIAGHPR